MLKKVTVPLFYSSNATRECVDLAVEVRGRGPLLVIVQAGASGIEGSAAIAPHLEKHFTVVSYDRRGLAGSPLPVGARTTIADHADDVARIVEHVGGGAAAFVVGVSIGAMIGLELVVRHPASVRQLVAFEPPYLTLLPEPRRTDLREAHAHVECVFIERGLDAALEAGAHLGQIDFADREHDVEIPAPTAELTRSLEFFLANDAAALREHEPPVDDGAVNANRIVVAAGKSAPDRWVRGIAQALAQRVGVPLTEMPGGHLSYVLRPQAFAAALTGLFV